MEYKSLTSNTSASSDDFYDDTSGREQRNLEDFLVVWLDSNIGKIGKSNFDILKNQLRGIINQLRKFDRPKACVEYIDRIVNEKIFLILSASFYRQILPVVSELEQVLSIYIWCGSSTHKILVKQQYEHKIIGNFADINSLCDRLKQEAATILNNFITINVLSPTISEANDNNDRRTESTFASALFYLERLREMKKSHDDRGTKIIDKCRLQYSDNKDQLKLVEEFDKDYHPNEAIWWYTRNLFLTNILSKAVRINDNDTLLQLQFFIFDIHQQLKQLHTQSSQAEPMVAYRGQGLSSEELDKLKSNLGGLLLISHFFLTYICKDTALSSLHRRVNVKSVLFQIEIDPTIKTNTSYAFIQQFSYSRKEEVLFSMGSVFRIKTITKIRRGIWNVILSLCEKEDNQLQYIRDTMNKALLSSVFKIRVTDDTTTFYRALYLNDIGKIYSKEKEEFVDAISLNFNQLKNEPRMIIDIKDDSSPSILCPSTKFLLCYCSNGDIYIFDRDGNVIKQTKWIYNYIYDICWSSFLDKFIIVADSPSFSIYIYDEKTNEIQHIENVLHSGRIKSYENCRCYLNIFSIGYHTTNMDLKISLYNVNNWKYIAGTFNEESLFDMRFSMTNYILIGVARRDWSKPPEEEGNWRFEVRKTIPTDTIIRTIQLDERIKSPRTVSLSNAEWLIYDTERNLLSLIDRTVKSQNTIHYNEDIMNATLMDENCFIILTTNNQLHFHDL